MADTQMTLRRRLLSLAVAGTLAVATLAFAAPANAETTFITNCHLRERGHNDFVDGGIRARTEGNTGTDETWGQFDVNADLADIGEPSMDTVLNDLTTTRLPGTWLFIDFDGDTRYDGYLVGEPTYADGSPRYGDDWWLDDLAKQFVKDAAPSHTGGFGSDNHGTLAQWRMAFPDAHIQRAGWWLGPGAESDVTIRSMTLGTTTYEFVIPNEPVVFDVSTSGKFNRWAHVLLKACDPQGGPLTYKVGKSPHGYTQQRPDPAAWFFPKRLFTGVATFSYTATDSQGLSTTGTVTVTVRRAPSKLHLNKQNTHQKNTANVSGRVMSEGNAKGGTIVVMENGSTVATATATGDYFKIKIPGSVPSGQHTYDVTFEGSVQAEPDSASVTLTVR